MLKASDSGWKPMRRDGLVRVWLVAVAVSGVVETTAFFGMDPQSRAAPAPVFRGVRATPEEIHRLHYELALASDGRRERAYDRLLKIGPPALWCSLPALKDGSPALQVSRNIQGVGLDLDPNFARLHYRLFEEIQRRHGIQAARENGLEFLPSIPSLPWIWRDPPAGQETVLDFRVKITNVGTKPLRIHHSGVGPVLVRANGEMVNRPVFGHGPSFLERYFPVLQPGASSLVTFTDVLLRRSADGRKLSLEYASPAGGYRAVARALTPGRYYLWFGCGYQPGKDMFGAPSKIDPLDWGGQTETPCIPIDIK